MENTQSLRIERVSKVWQPEARLIIPNADKEVVFASPSFESGTYSTIGKQVLETGILRMPTGQEHALLLHAAYCNPHVYDEQEFQDVRDKMRSRWLWEGTVNLWTDKGVYVVSDPKALGRSRDLPIDALEEMLEVSEEFNGVRINPETGVAFAPKDSYNLGEHTPEDLAEDGYMIARFMPEGAEKISQVAKEFKYHPKTWGVNVSKGSVPEKRLSALDDNWGGGGGLSVDGSFDDDDDGHAFGVYALDKKE